MFGQHLISILSDVKEYSYIEYFDLYSLKHNSLIFGFSFAFILGSG